MLRFPFNDEMKTSVRVMRLMVAVGMVRESLPNKAAEENKAATDCSKARLVGIHTLASDRVSV